MPLEVHRAKQIFREIESVVGVQDMDDDMDQVKDDDEEDVLEIDENDTITIERSQSPTGELKEVSILIISMYSRKFIYFLLYRSQPRLFLAAWTTLTFIVMLHLRSQPR
jgi:hypothetical protein